jgi:hypothetical protein
MRSLIHLQDSNFKLWIFPNKTEVKLFLLPFLLQYKLLSRVQRLNADPAIFFQVSLFHIPRGPYSSLS